VERLQWSAYARRIKRILRRVLQLHVKRQKTRMNPIKSAYSSDMALQVHEKYGTSMKDWKMWDDRYLSSIDILLSGNDVKRRFEKNLRGL
jgi:hypothetical protein